MNTVTPDVEIVGMVIPMFDFPNTNENNHTPSTPTINPPDTVTIN